MGQMLLRNPNKSHGPPCAETEVHQSTTSELKSQLDREGISHGKVAEEPIV